MGDTNMSNDFNLQEAIEKMSKRKYDIIAPLNDEQKIATINYKGPSVVEAIPGSGKTKLLVAKTAYMIEDGVDPASILLFSFTKKAANEIKERLTSAIGQNADAVTTSTFHSFCARNLRAVCDLIGYNRNFSIYDDEDKNYMILNAYKALQITDEDFPVRDISNRISRFKDKYMTPNKARAELDKNSNELDEIAVSVYEEYQRLMKIANAMDFDDLLFNMTTILEQNKNVRDLMHRKFKYISCDENQDSSYLDSKFVEYMVNPETRNICLLGDVDQSIYGFRGSNPDNLVLLCKKFNAKLYHLSTNYRSTKTIVAAGKSLIDHNPILMEEKHPRTDNLTGDKIINLTCGNREQEAIKISSIIENIVRLSEDDDTPVKYKNIAVLVRATYLTRVIEDAFLKYHIPYVIPSGTSFYNRMEIKDVMAYIKYVVNPRDMASLRRIINTPKRRLGDIAQSNIVDFMMQEAEKCDTMNIEGTINILNRFIDGDMAIYKSGAMFKNGLKSFVTAITKINAAIKDEKALPADIITKVIDTVDYKGHLEKTEETTYQERIENLNELKRLAHSFTDINEFIESVAIDSPTVENDGEGEPNAVQIMTMHGSKGLEFDIVILPTCNDDIIPHYRSKTKQEIQEERRLMYVAMTRAKNNLIISHTEKDFVFGRIKHCAPSRFINEINKEYLKDIKCC